MVSETMMVAEQARAGQKADRGRRAAHSEMRFPFPSKALALQAMAVLDVDKPMNPEQTRRQYAVSDKAELLVYVALAPDRLTE